MKKIVLSLIAVIGYVYLANAVEINVRVTPKIRQLSTNKTQTVNISSTTWTNVLTTNDTYRAGVLITVPRTNTEGMMIYMSTSPTVALAGLTTSVNGHYIKPDTGNLLDLEVSGDIYVFAISSQTAAASEPIIYTEYRSTKE